MPHSPEFSKQDIEQRRDAAILHALTTPAREQKAEAPPQSAKAEAQRKRHGSPGMCVRYRPRPAWPDCYTENQTQPRIGEGAVPHNANRCPASRA
jgi:hypothetical protein